MRHGGQVRRSISSYRHVLQLVACIALVATPSAARHVYAAGAFHDVGGAGPVAPAAHTHLKVLERHVKTTVRTSSTRDGAAWKFLDVSSFLACPDPVACSLSSPHFPLSILVLPLVLPNARPALIPTLVG